VAIAAGGAGSYISEYLNSRRAAAADRRVAVAGPVNRQAVLAAAGVVSPAESVSGLLRPERGVVEFTGRSVELAGLAVWCQDAGVCPVSLVTGVGGVGKTRLALRLGEVLTDAPGGDWKVSPVQVGAELEAFDSACALVREDGKRVLLVVDYAETRTRLPSMLAEVASWEAAGNDGVRVLLVARAAGEWWSELDTDSDLVSDLISRVAALELAAALDETRSDVEVIEAAVVVFAFLRGVRVPETTFTIGGDVRLPVLVLHAAALVAVLDAESGEPGGRAAVNLGVLDRLLGHERRLWHRTAQRAGLHVRLAVLQQVVAVVALLLDPQQNVRVEEVVRRVPDLDGVDGERVGAVVAWLRQLYPDATNGVSGLQPDLLAERHAVTQLTDHPSLVEACFAGLGELSAVRALTVLSRACTHDTRAPELLDQVLRRDLNGLAAAAVVVAVQTGTRMGQLLANVLTDIPAGREDLQRISESIPHPTVALAQANAIVTRRIHGLLPEDAEPADRARWGERLSLVLHQIGQRHEALQVGIQVLQLRRELASTNSDRYRPDLAESLSNLGVWFSELGRPADALPVAQEAFQIYLELVRTDPDRYRPELATSLSNLGVRFSALGRPADALPVTQESVEIRRELARINPDRYRPDLADSLNNLGVRFSEFGRPADALPVTQEAVEIRRELARANPDRYRPDLATSLSNLGVRFSALGRPADALSAAQEAVEIWRELARTNPDRYRPGLAGSLNNLGVAFSALGRPADALTVTQEAVQIRRELAQTNPDRYRSDLARSLFNLGSRFSEFGRPADALPAEEEAVQIYHELVQTNPDRYRPDLADSLNNLGATYSELGRPADAQLMQAEARRLREL
jgi:tetratricopeptide (TPR) repeat protein